MQVSIINPLLITSRTWRGVKGLLAVTSQRGNYRTRRSIERPTRNFNGLWLEEGHRQYDHIILQEVL